MSNKPRVLYISLTGMGEALGQSQVLEYLLPLSDRYSITLISYERMEDEDQKNHLISLIDDKIEWIPLRYSNRFGAISTLASLVQGFFAAYKTAKKQRFDIVHCRSMIPTILGFLLKKIYNSKLLFDIRGFAIDERADRGRIKRGGLLYGILKLIENKLYRKSDHIVSLTYKAKEILLNDFEMKKDSEISVITTCASKETFFLLDEKERIQFRKKLGYSGSNTVFVHTGNVGTWYEFEKEIQVFKEMVKLDEQVRFLIVNKGQHDLVKTICSKHELNNEYVQLTSSSFKEVNKYLNAADFALFFIRPSYSKQASAPTKFAESIAAYLPAISNSGVGDMEYYLSNYQVGKCVDIDFFDPKKIAKAILFRKTEVQYSEFDRLYADEFDKKNAVKKYDEIYRKLVGSQKVKLKKDG